MNDAKGSTGDPGPASGFEDIHQQEKDALGVDQTANATGLALSGGGIRSASFGLGVIQALLEHGVMQKIDYLSTVSGGGYIGASLTWNRHIASGAGSFFGGASPFGVKGLGTRTHPQPAAHGRDPDAGPSFLDFLRQHGNYLNPSRRMNIGSAIGVALRNLLISFLIYFSLLLIAISSWTLVTNLAARAIPESTGFHHWVFQIQREAATPNTLQNPNAEQTPAPIPKTPSDPAAENEGTSGSTGPRQDAQWMLHPFFYINLLVACIILCLSILYGFLFSALTYVISLKHSKEGAASYNNRNLFQWFSGLLLAGFCLFLFLALIPPITDLFSRWINVNGLGAVGVVSGMWAAISKFRKFLGGESVFKKASWIGNRLFEVGAFLFLFLMVIYSYYLCLEIGVPATVTDPIRLLPLMVLLLIGVLALVAAVFVNLNHASLGRMYRDRLMEAFLPDATSIKNNVWDFAWQANGALLADMCKAKDAAMRKPYHLINTNVILTGSKKEKFRRRGGDSFVLSPLYCGSDATGFVTTKRFMRKKNKTNGGLTLATAMAISGAAVNPHTAVAGKGPTRGPLVSMLMTVFNLRLGAWVSNPKHDPSWQVMNYIKPGLCSLLCIGHDENWRCLELTDGGHFENLGLYELVKRRVGTIIVSDAGVDKDFKFGDLANAIEKVRTDFGVSIRFEPEDQILNRLLPGTATNGKLTEKYKLAERGYIEGVIKYPPTKGESAFEGRLLLIKSTLVKNLPADLYSYKAHHEAFPDQPTSDQFFDEKQFEVYRELGYRLADTMCRELDLHYA